MSYTEKNRIDWIVNNVENIKHIFNANNVMYQLEPLSNTLLQKPQLVVFTVPSEVVENCLNCEYRSTLFHIVWITEKKSRVVDQISKFNEYFPQVFFDNMQDVDNPFVLLKTFSVGVGNENNPIDYLGGVNYKHKLVMYCDITMQYRYIITV